MAVAVRAMSPSPPPGAKRAPQGRELPTQLPLIRVKRIIKVDKDIQKCGNEAATLITRATVRPNPAPQLSNFDLGIICSISR